MRRPTLLLLLCLAIATATIVGACSSAVAPGSPSPSAPVATLDGKVYLSTDVNGAVLAPGTRIQLTFRDGSLGANGGCNTMSGTYAIEAGRLKTSQLATTEMGCDEPRMQQDQWLGRLLGDAGISLAGDTLTLTDGTITVTLLDREVATPDKPIEGTRWVLDGIVSGDAVSSVPAGVTAALRIADSRVQVETGCNSGGGAVTVTAQTLTFGSIGLTKKACEPGAMAVERSVIGVLTGTVGYTIEADALTLDAGGQGLTFRAAP
jgi:heat shock protein HslJ